MRRSTLLAAACFFAAPALADEALTIPPVAIDPHPTPSLWNGLYVGSGVTVSAAKGQKGRFGGDAFAGYDKTFHNHLVLGLKLDTGYAPMLTAGGRFQGFDYALGSAKLGYDFGRVTPYVYAGGGLARATAFPSGFADPAATMNGAFGQGPGAGVTVFGAGFDYRVTNNLTVGASMGVLRGPGTEAGF